MQLPSIGHPFIDENQTRAVLVQELAQRISRARGLFVVCLDALVGILAASCQAISPHNVWTMVPSGFFAGFPGDIRFPTRTTRFTFAGRALTLASWRIASTPESSVGGVPEKSW